MRFPPVWSSFPPVLLLALVLGLGLRLWGLDAVHFGLDEGYAAALATQIGWGRGFPLIGIRTSFGFCNPPLFLYLLAPVFAVVRSPVAGGALMAVAGAAAGALAAGGGRALAGRRAAVLAGVLVALLPNAVEHSRRLWGHDTVVAWSALACWGLLRGGALRRGWMVGAGIAAIAAAQSHHLSAVVLWAGVPPAWLALPRRECGRAVLLGGGALLGCYAPWIVHEAQEGWPDSRLIAAQIAGGAAGRDLGLAVHPLAAWTQVLGDFWANDLLGGRRPWDLGAWGAAGSGVASGLGMVLLATGLGWGLATLKGASRRRRLLVLTLLLPVVANAVVFGMLFRASVPPYFLPSLVPAALLAAGGLRGAGRGLPWVLAAVLVLGTSTLPVRGALVRGEVPNPRLSDYLALAQELSARVQREPFAFHQDARAATTGPDVGWIYMLHVEDLSDLYRAGRQEPAAPLFVVRDARVRVAPAVDDFLKRFAVARRGPLTLHAVPGSVRPLWEQALSASARPRATSPSP